MALRAVEVRASTDYGPRSRYLLGSLMASMLSRVKAKVAR